jgi:DNA-directed RNA polymerase specialized sigma subunit
VNFQKMQEAAIKDLEDYNRLAASEDSTDRQRAAVISRALHMLPEREQDMLSQFFIDRERRYAGHRARLTAKYGLCISDLYRLKNQALTNYSVSLLALRAAATCDRK